MLGSDRTEIADRGIIGALSVVEAADHLGDDEIEIGIALAVGIGWAIDRHVVDEIGEINAVIEILSTQQKLVGLALACMDRDHEAGYRLQQLSGAENRPQLNLFLRHGPLARGVHRSQQILTRGGDDDIVYRIRARGSSADKKLCEYKYRGRGS